MDHNHNHEQKGMTCGMCGCGCGHHKIKPLAIVLIGLLFLLHNGLGYFTAGFVAVAWPTLVLVAGLSKLVRCKCC